MSSWLATRWPRRGDVGVQRPPATRGLARPDNALTRGDLGDLGDEDNGGVGVKRGAGLLEGPRREGDCSQTRDGGDADTLIPSRTNQRGLSDEATGGDRLWARNSNFETFSTKSTLLSMSKEAGEGAPGLPT